MLRIRSLPSTLPSYAIRKEIGLFIERNKKITTFFNGKKRFIFLDTYILIQEGRRDKGRRFRLFFPCVELIKNAQPSDISMHRMNEWELIGICPDGSCCAVHIREEKRGKDTILRLISTFEKT